MLTLQSLANFAEERSRYPFSQLLKKEIGNENLMCSLIYSLPEIILHRARKIDQHKNGFFRVLIAIDKDSFAMVRLHIWNFNTLNNLPHNIHSHAWNFWSFIAVGALKINKYSETNGSVYFRNIAATGKQKLSGCSTSECSLKKVNSISVHKGNWHEGEYDEIHHVKPLIAPCISIFFQGPHERSFSYFYSESEVSVTHPTVLTLKEIHFLSKCVSTALVNDS